ncbi:MAG: hypothetical protein ABI577_13235 [bacterium]
MFSTYRPVAFEGFDEEFGGALERALCGARYSVERAWESAASHCYVLDVEGKGKLFLKRASPGKKLTDRASIYERINEAGSELRPLFPRFEGAVEGFEAMLFEYVEGVTLREALRAGTAGSNVARPLLKALKTYHRVEGAAIGDFHGGNVMVDGGRVLLLDPSAPDRHGMEPGEVPLTTDLGHWVASGAANFMSDARRAPKLAWRLFGFNRAMLKLGIAGTGSSKADVLAVAGRHLSVLRTDPFRMSRISFFPGWVYLRVLGWSVR